MNHGMTIYTQNNNQNHKTFIGGTILHIEDLITSRYKYTGRTNGTYSISNPTFRLPIYKIISLKESLGNNFFFPPYIFLAVCDKNTFNKHSVTTLVYLEAQNNYLKT